VPFRAAALVTLAVRVGAASPPAKLLGLAPALLAMVKVGSTATFSVTGAVVMVVVVAGMPSLLVMTQT